MTIEDASVVENLMRQGVLTSGEYIRVVSRMANDKATQIANEFEHKKQRAEYLIRKAESKE